MSYDLMARVARKSIGGTVRRQLMLVLADHANPDGTGIWASIATLAIEIEGSDRTVQTRMREFLAEGLVREVGKRTCANGYTVEYAINVDSLEALPDLPRRPIGGRQKTADVPVQQLHQPTGAGDSPVQQIHPTGAADSPVPVQQIHPTGAAAAPKPILEPILEPTLEPSLGGTPAFAADPPTGPSGKLDLLGQPPAAAPKSRAKSYPADFEVFWAMWPRQRRERSDKRMAASRWATAVRTWDAETVTGAAKRYLGQKETIKENYRFCVLAEVFLNGKLEAQVEAYFGGRKPRSGGKGQARWSSADQAWVYEDGTLAPQPEGMGL